MISYSSSKGQNESYKIVQIIQSNLSNFSVTGQEKGGGPQYTIDLSTFIGGFGYNPTVGEEWIIKLVLGKWVLDRRSYFQNATILDLQSSTSGTTLFAGQGDLIVNGGVVNPTGTILLWAGSSSTVPEGYLICDGSTVNKSAYPGLYAALNPVYATGALSSTFVLPNLTAPKDNNYPSSPTFLFYIIKT